MNIIIIIIIIVIIIVTKAITLQIFHNGPEFYSEMDNCNNPLIRNVLFWEFAARKTFTHEWEENLIHQRNV